MTKEARSTKYEGSKSATRFSFTASLLSHSLVIWISPLVIFLGFAVNVALGADESLARDFEQANKLYEQGKYKDAVAAYQKLIERGVESPAVYFNLGNAWYKAGQNGRAVAAYLRAERLAPRDPGIRFNLDCVRRKVSGQGASVPFWQRWLRRLSMNEWALAAAAGLWVWLLLLAAREFRPAWRTSLRGYTLWTGIVAASLVLALGAAVYERTETKTAVVVAPEATVHYGPLEESQAFYKLQDGAEVQILDEKTNSPQDAWVQIEDVNGRPGWVKREQVLNVFAEGAKRKLG